MKKKIPFNKPFIIGKELYNIARAVIEHGHLSGNGPFTKNCTQWLEDNFGCKKALLTHTCTAAIEMAAILCNINKGDEVIMPSFTFVATATAFALRGAKPVFIDIRKDNFNIDETLIEDAITQRTKAIVPVHYAGFSCAMEEILDIAGRNNLYVIEDAAQGFLSTNGEKILGTIGHLGCLSFHETKNVISGEGGAILINDEQLISRAEIVCEKGTDRARFSRGEVEKYTWMDLGSSFMPSELVAAFLWAQLEHAEEIVQRRISRFNNYYERLKPLEDNELITLPALGEDINCNGHIFYLLTKSGEERTSLLQYLAEHDILAVFHFVPLHSSPAGKRYGQTQSSMTVTNDISSRLLRLPLYYEMTEEELDIVVDAIYQFYGKCYRKSI